MRPIGEKVLLAFVMRRRAKHIPIAAILACLSLIAPTKLPAQRGFGPEQLPFYEAVTRSFLTCFANRRRAGVERWLSTLPGSREERAVYRQLANDFPACWEFGNYIVPPMHFTPSELRYRFAAHLLKERYPTLPPQSPLSENSVAWFESQLAAVESDAPLNREALVEQNLAFCLARTRWADIVRFHSAEPATDEEREAFRALAPHMTACVPAGAQIEMRAALLREILAEGLYHILSGSSR